MKWRQTLTGKKKLMKYAPRYIQIRYDEMYSPPPVLNQHKWVHVMELLGFSAEETQAKLDSFEAKTVVTNTGHQADTIENFSELSSWLEGTEHQRWLH